MSLWVKNGWKENCLRTVNIIFIHLLVSFIVQKLLTEDGSYDLQQCIIFGPKMKRRTFSGKLLTQFLWTSWPLSLCNILKKSLEKIPSYNQATSLGWKWLICPKEFFFFQETTKIIFMQLLAPFIVENS